MAGEDNKYVAVFESIPKPAILLDDKYAIDNMNSLAAKFLKEMGVATGKNSKASVLKKTAGQDIQKLFPWLAEHLTALQSGKSSVLQFEKELPGTELSKYFRGSLSKVSDGSGQFTGTLLVLEDIGEQREMAAQIHELSITDELTGLFNRRGALAMANKLLSLSERGNCELYILSIGFDNLKWINDRLGHTAGDAALVETAEVLRSTFRQADVVGRLGGDEFIVLITDKIDTDNEAVILTRLKENIRKCNLQKKRKFEISISVGVAKYDHSAAGSLDELLSCAERRMREQKEKKKKNSKGPYGG